MSKKPVLLLHFGFNIRHFWTILWIAHSGKTSLLMYFLHIWRKIIFKHFFNINKTRSLLCGICDRFLNLDNTNIKNNFNITFLTWKMLLYLYIIGCHLIPITIKQSKLIYFLMNRPLPAITITFFCWFFLAKLLLMFYRR